MDVLTLKVWVFATTSLIRPPGKSTKVSSEVDGLGDWWRLLESLLVAWTRVQQNIPTCLQPCGWRPPRQD